jgi:hypothetical protein
MDKQLIFGRFRFFYMEVTISAGCRDLTVSADLACRRVSKFRNFQLNFSTSKNRINFFLKIILKIMLFSLKITKYLFILFKISFFSHSSAHRVSRNALISAACRDSWLISGFFFVHLRYGKLYVFEVKGFVTRKDKHFKH